MKDDGLTHIRQGASLDCGLATYCGAPPRETISVRHYRESLDPTTAQWGHVDRLPAPLCETCQRL